MAIQLGGNQGEMRLVLRVKDDGSVVIDKFADNVDKGAAKSSAAWSKYGKVIGAIGIATSATMAVIVKRQIDVADAASKTADKLNLTVEALTGLRYHADLAGVGNEALNVSLQMMARNLGDATAGTGEAQDAIKALGLEADVLARMRPEQAVMAIANAMERVPPGAQRVQIAMDIFGRSGADMINVMRGGAAAIRDGMNEAKEFGQVISTDTARRAELFNDNLSRMGALVKGSAISMADNFLPSLIDITDQMIAAYKAGGLLEAVIAGIGAVTTDTPKRIANLTREITLLEAELRRLKDLDIGSILDEGGDFTGDEAEAIESKIAAKRKELKELEDSIKRNKDAINRKPPEVGDLGGAKLNQKTLDELAKNAQDIAEAEAERIVAAKEAARKRAEDLRQSLLSEQELEAASYAERIASLYELNQTVVEIDDEGNTARLISDTEFIRMREQLRLEHEAKLGSIEAQGLLERQRFEQQTMRQRTQTVIGEIVALTQGVAAHNKTMFKINQLAGIANATINAYEGASRTLAKYPWPIGPALAALHLAAGLAQVQAIRAAKFGSATSAPSVAGGGAIPVESVGPPTVAPFESGQPGASQSVVQVIVNGNFIGNEEAAEWLGNVIKDKITNNDLILITPASRQARELTTAPA